MTLPQWCDGDSSLNNSFLSGAQCLPLAFPICSLAQVSLANILAYGYDDVSYGRVYELDL